MVGNNKIVEATDDFKYDGGVNLFKLELKKKYADGDGIGMRNKKELSIKL